MNKVCESLSYFLVAVLLLAAFTGCESEAPAATRNYKPLAAAILATELGDVPQPTPAPAPSPSGKCDNCGGKGKLGDGVVSVTCPVCGGDGIKSEPAPDIAQEATPDISQPDCPCPNCTCDPCECKSPEAVASHRELPEVATTYRPEQINGAWYCTHNGQRLKWTAVRCYGPDVPCDYEWRPVSAPQSNYSETPNSSACATGNCGTSAPGRTIRRGRLFGRR